jgi:hypothetical protein
VKFDALADANGDDVAVAAAVKGVVYRLARWVKKDLFWHYFNDDFWHRNS